MKGGGWLLNCMLRGKVLLTEFLSSSMTTGYVSMLLLLRECLADDVLKGSDPRHLGGTVH